MDNLWSPHPALAAASRWQSRGTLRFAGTATLEIPLLVALGILAATLTSISAMPLPLPGHAILRGTLPVLLGISLVPRRGSGTFMSLVAALAWLAIRLAGLGPMNPAAMTGLVCLGPLLDGALVNARPGWKLYGRAALAGMLANLVAFAVRLGAASWLGVDGRAQGFLSFWPLALVSFAAFGASAGFLSGAVWFRSQPRERTT